MSLTILEIQAKYGKDYPTAFKGGASSVMRARVDLLEAFYAKQCSALDRKYARKFGEPEWLVRGQENLVPSGPPGENICFIGTAAYKVTKWEKDPKGEWIPVALERV